MVNEGAGTYVNDTKHSFICPVCENEVQGEHKFAADAKYEIINESKHGKGWYVCYSYIPLEEHQYSSDCDTKCNVCNAEREAGIPNFSQ